MHTNQSLIKSYANCRYQYPTMVSHKGTVVAFAMDAGTQQIYYTVLALEQDNESKSPLDVNYWLENPLPLKFANEIVKVGFGLISPTSMPIVAKDSRNEAEPGTLRKEEIDPFLSSTARLTANAPFQILSDNQYIYVFRQSIADQHSDMLYQLKNGKFSGDTSKPANEFVQDNGEQKVPLVNNTLLLDRYILAGTQLQPKMEVRYKRSRNKSQPASNKDSLGAEDIEGNTFYEPTQELDFIRNLHYGRFQVLLLPTQVANIQRWQIFTHKSGTQRIDSFNIERSGDGLFNTKGTRFYTSPDPKHKNAVFERNPGNCPFTNDPLIQIVSQSDYAGCALEFNGSSNYVKLGDNVKVGNNFTLEAWIYPTATDEKYHCIFGDPICTNNIDRSPSFFVAGKKIYSFFGDGNLSYSFATQDDVLTPGTWYHVAWTFDGEESKLYVNGNNKSLNNPKKALGKTPKDTRIKSIGDERNPFQGKIEEVRVWKRARSAEEIREDMHHFLVGNEPGLVGYWKLDEGKGNTTYDQTDNANDGTIHSGATWVTSDAPIGENPGIQRSSFSFTDKENNGSENLRTIESGLSALLYYQQEDTKTGYDGQDKPMKKNARVMVTVATGGKALAQSSTEKKYVAALDFAVSREGKLAQVSNNITLNPLTSSKNEILENLSKQQQRESELLGKIGAPPQSVRIDAGDNKQDDALFGYSVAISGDWAIVGAPDETVSGKKRAGRAYVFKRNRNSWTLHGNPLDAGDNKQDEAQFGFSVAISGDWAIVGAYNETVSGKKQAGRAYVFKRNGNSWTLHGNPLDAGDNKQDKAQFGFSVAISGDWAIVGAPCLIASSKLDGGRAYVFKHNGESWTSHGNPLDAGDNKQDGALFGYSVAISGDWAIVGAHKETVSGKKLAGRAYVFKRNRNSWTLHGNPLDAGDNKQDGAQFGYSVAISGDWAIVGAPFERSGSKSFDGGRTYVFKRNSDSWTSHGNPLDAGDNKQDKAQFGFSVAISGDWAIVGAPEKYLGERNIGKAYVFKLDPNNNWTLQDHLLDVNDNQKTGFGFSVAISDGRAITGAPYQTSDGKRPGRAYLFDILRASLLAELKRVSEEIHQLKATQTENPQPMPLLHTDPHGLTVSGALLSFAHIEDAPLLFDSATGQLALYFRGSNGQFFAAYYDTKTARSQQELAFGSYKIIFIARSAGDATDKATIKVEDSHSAETCKVTITNKDITETWDKVPRNPQKFAAVLNGQAEPAVEIATVKPISSTVTSLPLETKTNRVIPVGATLKIGNTKVTVSKEVSKESDSIIIDSATVNATNNAPVYLIAYDYANATVTPAGYSLAQGSLHFVAYPTKATGTVPNGTATKGGSTPNCQWVADSPGKTRDFNGNDAFASIATERVVQVDAKSNLTLEAWVLPKKVDNTARLIHHNSNNSKYTLGLKKQDLLSALEFNGSGNYVDLGDNVKVDKNFTLEAWIYPTTTDDNYHGFLGNDPASINARSPSLWVKGKKIYGCFGDGTKKYDFTTQADVLTPSTWYHVAWTFDGEVFKLYVNGNETSLDTPKAGQGKKPKDTPIKYIGKVDHFFGGKIDEVRVWNRARTQQDIKEDMERRLSGNEPGLIGYWHFEEGIARDYTGKGNDGVLSSTPANSNKVTPSPLNSYVVFAGVNNQFIQSTAPISSKNWTHLAATFNQSYALEFKGEAYLDCGNNVSLDIQQDLTLEFFLQLNAKDKKQGILTKGILGDGTKQSVPYSLYIDSDNKIAFAFEDREGKTHTYKSSIDIEANKFYKIALTRKGGTDKIEKKTTKKIGDEEHEVTESVEVKEWDEIRFYINGDNKGTHKYEGSRPKGHKGALEIGRTYLGKVTLASFNGKISEVRIWNTARDPKDVNSTIQGKEKGLIAWWRFEENEGNIASDDKAGNHAKLKGATWVKNPDPEGSSFLLYANGIPVESKFVASTEPPASTEWGATQFTLGCRRKESGAEEYFQGVLDQVRIWKVARTQEQILDNLFTRLRGEKEDLLAYYTFDSDEEKSLEIKDSSLPRNHLTCSAEDKPNSILSTAPISEDTAQVRSALAGIKTPFHELIDSRPAVQEYSDVQYDSSGNLVGVFKRCYAYIQDGKWKLLTGYKVGNLITEWISQVQFDPQVIGYIEGAPPVPSENFTVGALSTDVGQDYSNLSTLEVVEAETVNYSFSASKEGSFDTAFDIAAKLGFDMTGEFIQVVAPMGFGVGFSQTMMDLKINAGLQAKMETSNGWSSDNNVGAARNLTKSTSVTLAGNWEDPKKILNSALGQRFQPTNMGFALVQSETADVFALRMAHNNALVAFRFQPNPDIPKDWNIIPFPINPQYTKQGTLDGAVGYDDKGKVNDPDYLNATGYGEYSYFKPKEAYAIKNRIQREEEELVNYYEHFVTNPLKTAEDAMGSELGAIVGGAGGLLGAGIGSQISKMAGALSQNNTLPKKIGKRNLVNTYVWTADGGFFAESTETTDVRQETTGGSFKLSGQGGGTLGIETTIFGANASFEFNAAVGGSINVARTKTKGSERTFSINVTIGTPGDLQKYEKIKDTWQRRYDPENGNAVNMPGKVDAYRFMTFYLDSNSENFDDLYNKVVDPTWLAQSNQANAVALRQAQQSEKKPPCWRVFHRVTFISRLLPELPSPTEAPLEAAMQAQNIDSNWQLIQTLSPFVRNATGSFSQFSDAVHNALDTYLPNLLPHEGDIIKYLALYFEVKETV